MNKKQYLNLLTNEISKLNRSIDRKILMGYSYENDARRHRELLDTVKRIQRRRNVGMMFNGLFRQTLRGAFMFFL